MAAEPTYRIRNWHDFQHYGQRVPPWIKLHRSLLNNREWNALSGDASKVLVECWLVGSEDKDGLIYLDCADLAWRLRRNERDMARWLEELVALGFLERCGDDASAALAPCLQDACLEVEEEKERETEKEIEGEGVAVAPPAPRKRATALPGDWQPNDSHRQLAATMLGVRLSVEVQKFRDHFTANGKPMKDWDAAFRNWLRRAAEFSAGRVQPGSEASTIREELPRSTAPRQVADPLEDRRKQESDERQRVAAWTKDHADEARTIMAQVKAMMDGPEWRNAPAAMRDATAAGEYAKRVLDKLRPVAA